jgi:Flp pilus assembly protein TadG
MAVVAPLLLAILFGTMQFGYIFLVQNTVTNATREACRVGVLQGSTTADVTARFNEAMSHIGFTSGDYTLTVTAATTATPIVTVRAQIPFSKVNFFGSWLGLTKSHIGSVCSMRKEGTV